MAEDLELEGRQGKRKEKLIVLQTVERDATLQTMKTKEGRLMVWRILGRSGYLSSSFTGDSRTFFNEGRRAVGLEIYQELMNVCPELYWAMLRENTKEKTNA